MRVGYLAVALISVLITLAGVEILVRIQGIDRTPLNIYPSKETRQVEGGLVFCPAPTVTRAYFENRKRFPGCVFYPRNNAGLRNLFDLKDDGASPLRIVGLGDSMVFGYGVDHEDTFLYKLHESLNARIGSGRVEVINSARPGYDLEDAYGLMQRHVLSLEPRLIILGLHLNDFLKFPTQLIRTPRDYSIRKYFQLVDLLLYRWEKKEGGEINEREALASFDEEAKAGLFKQLKAFDTTLEERKISLLVLIFPLFVKLDDYPFRQIHLEIGEFLTAERIEHIDFLQDFSGREDDQYWITLDDQHPNEIAHQVFFERVSTYVDEYLGAG